jgi:hypothetical protein
MGRKSHTWAPLNKAKGKNAFARKKDLTKA